MHWVSHVGVGVLVFEFSFRVFLEAQNVDGAFVKNVEFFVGILILGARCAGVVECGLVVCTWAS